MGMEEVHDGVPRGAFCQIKVPSSNARWTRLSAFFRALGPYAICGKIGRVASEEV